MLPWPRPAGATESEWLAPLSGYANRTLSLRYGPVMSSDPRTGSPAFAQADTRTQVTSVGPPETISQPVPVHPPLPALPLPALPGYEMLEVIARGGMGVVYKARQLSLNRMVAVKMILGGGHQDPTAVARFLIEAEAVARIQHPHVVPVYEFGRHDGLPYLAMELVDGGTLAQKVIREGKLDPRRAADILEKVAGAVAAAHAQGVIHRDLKPGNILLTAAGEPKVTDFGMAKVGDLQLTASGAMVGTPSYMSPEQARGKGREVGTTADVWALGCVLYTLLTARLPFEADSHPATLALVVGTDPDRPRAVAPHVPRDLETVCLKCLEKEPARRYPTAAALADDLGRFLRGEPILARPVSAAERAWKWARRHPGRAAAWAGVVAAFLAAVGVAVAADRWYQHRQREEKADDLVFGLLGADPAAVPVFVAELDRDGVRDLALPQLRAKAEQPIHTRVGLHARIALLPDEPARAGELVRYVPTCRLNELPLFASLVACAGEADALWAVVESPASKPAAVLRAAAVLAAWAPKDRRWVASADAVGGHLARANPIEAEVYAAAFRPIAPLLPVLMARYQDARRRLESGRLAGEDLIVAFNEFHVSAKLLADNVAVGHPAELTELAITVSETHYLLFADAVLAHRAELLPRLRAELAGNRPSQDWAAVAAGAVPMELVAAAVLGVASERGFSLPEAAIDAAAKRRGHAAALLVLLGEAETVWPLLRDRADPTACSYLLARLPVVGVTADVLADRYAAEPDVGAKRAVLHALGDYRPADVSAARLGTLASILLAEYEHHSDPGLHSSIGWLLRHRWGREAEVAALDAQLTAAATPAAIALLGPVAGRPVGRDRGWVVNGQGQTYAIVRGPVGVRLGSPATDPDHFHHPIREPGRREVIPHSFAGAAHEVTAGEFARFLAATGKRPPPAVVDQPAAKVTWYEAAHYCNWLSEQDGIPPDQWCYQPNEQGKYEAGMTIRPDRLSLRGYRLPTEVEWECTCRAGGDHTRFYGRGTDLLGRYGWFAGTADGVRPVGRLRPNEWGLFDTLGNVWEWCEDTAWLDTPDKLIKSYWKLVDDDHRRVYHGGSFVDGSGSLRPANRNSYRPVETNFNIGFRPVRSLP